MLLAIGLRSFDRRVGLTDRDLLGLARCFLCGGLAFRGLGCLRLGGGLPDCREPGLPLRGGLCRGLERPLLCGGLADRDLLRDGSRLRRGGLGRRGLGWRGGLDRRFLCGGLADRLGLGRLLGLPERDRLGLARPFLWAGLGDRDLLGSRFLGGGLRARRGLGMFALRGGLADLELERLERRCRSDGLLDRDRLGRPGQNNEVFVYTR